MVKYYPTKAAAEADLATMLGWPKRRIKQVTEQESIWMQGYYYIQAAPGMVVHESDRVAPAADMTA